MTPHSSTLAWKIPWTEDTDRLQSMGLQRVWHDWMTSLSLVCITVSLRCTPETNATWLIYCVVQSLSRVWLFVTPWTSAHQASLSFTITHVHWIGDAIQPSHPLSSPSPPAFNFSQHQDLFQGASSSHQVAIFKMESPEKWNIVT